MSKILITGSFGLVGAACVRHFSTMFDEVVGVDDNSRKKFFGVDRPTDIFKDIPNYTHLHKSVSMISPKDLWGCNFIIHAAAQPSHDWATDNVMIDFQVNALSTISLLEDCRKHCPDAVFIYCSTNKVYGDYPNTLPYKDTEKRIEPSFFTMNGFDELTPIDMQLHSFFGCSKLAADLYVQEYGLHLGMKTGVFRMGCITGKGHGGARLHGFLSYLVFCAKTGLKYVIEGYRGKQVRDNIHASDLAAAFEQFYKKPQQGEVYNLGGGWDNSCSILEAIETIEQLSGLKVDFSLSDKHRTGDHLWWITDNGKFELDYPDWKLKMNLKDIFDELLSEEFIQ